MNNKVRHVLGLSGGKDSAALAVHMNNNYPNIPVEYYFTDTGYELSETYDYLDKLKTRLDKPIKYIQPTNSFDYYMKKYNNFLPSHTARWCTIEMKLKSFEQWIKPSLDLGTEVFTYIGIRFDERGRIGYKPTNELIKPKFPFIDDHINKENFIQLLQNMGYKTYKKDEDVYFIYALNKKNFRKKAKQIDKIDNPFKILSQLNLK